MGLILMPLVLVWFLALVLTLYTGYGLLNSIESYTNAILIFVFAISLSLLYAYWGLSRFKEIQSLGAFEIPIFFAINKYAIGCYLLVVLAYWFFAEQYEELYLKVVLFIFGFASSLGTLMGIFFADKFMQINNIRAEY